MKRPSRQSISRWLVFDFFRRNLKAFAFVLVLAIPPIVLFTNEPVSSRIIEGRFVRWNAISKQGPPLVRVFVDLPDGRTTAIEAWSGWQPPPAGSVIRLHELTLLWFGKDYRLAP